MNALHPRAAAAAVSAASPRHAAPRRAARLPLARPRRPRRPGRELPRPGRMDQGRAAVQARRPGGLGGLGGGERARPPPPPPPLLSSPPPPRVGNPSPATPTRAPRRSKPRAPLVGGRDPSRTLRLAATERAAKLSDEASRFSSSRLSESAPRSASGSAVDVDSSISIDPVDARLAALERIARVEEASTSRAASRAAAIRASLERPDEALIRRRREARRRAKLDQIQDGWRDLLDVPGRNDRGRALDERRAGDGATPGPGAYDRAREPRGSPRRRLVLAGVRRDVEARAPGDARSLAVARPGRVRGGRPKGGARRREPSATGRRETREGGARDVHHRRAKILRGGEKARRKPGRRRKPSRARPGGPARVVASEGSEDENERSGGGGETNTRAVRYVRRAVRGVRRSARVGVGEGYPARERVESSEGEGKRKRPAAVRRRRVRARTHPGRRSGSGSGSGSLPPRSDRLVGGDDARLSRAGRDAGARGVRRAGPVAAAARGGGGPRRRSATSRAAFSFQARSALGTPSPSERLRTPRERPLGLRRRSRRDGSRRRRVPAPGRTKSRRERGKRFRRGGQVSGAGPRGSKPRSRRRARGSTPPRTRTTACSSEVLTSPSTRDEW